MPDHRDLVRIPFLEASPLDGYRDIERPRTLRLDQAILISEGDDGVESNLAAVFGAMSPDEFARIAADFFADQQFTVVVESESAAALEEHLAAEGWTLDEEEIAMVLTSDPNLPSPPGELDLQHVATETSYEDYMQVVPGNRDWVPNLEAATDPGVGLFVGYVGQKPVATARLVCYGQVAEITGVQTLEDHRRKGYGRAMTAAAIAEALQRGCTAVTLTATEMGYPLYTGMGFETVCTYRTYLPPDDR